MSDKTPDEVGDIYEEIVLKELLKYNPNAVKNGIIGVGGYREEYAWYDFVDFGGIEVKGDEIADSSNRYGFDKHTNGKESGLLVTKAYWHVLFTLTKYYIIKTDNLKWLCDYNGTFRYYHPIAGKYINVAVLHDENFYNTKSKNIMDFYRIPVPAIEMFSHDSGKIEDFNLNSIL